MARAKAGDPFHPSAAEWNRLQEVSEWYQRTKSRGDTKRKGQGHYDTNLVEVKNNTGADLRRGEVVELSSFLLSDVTGGALWFVGSVPDLSRPGYGVALRTIPNNGIDTCQTLGTCYALVNITDANHQYASVKSGEKVLQSATNGSVRILYKPSGTGEKKCAVLIGGSTGSPIYIGKTDSAVAKGATGTVSRYVGGTEADSGSNDQVKFLLSGSMANKWVTYSEIGGTFYAVDTEKELQTVLTDVQIDGTSFQKKSRSVYLTPSAAESAWTNWHAGTECVTSP